MNNHSHTTDALPLWLQEQCTRLLQQDTELWNLNLNIRRLDEFLMAYLAEALRQNNVLRILNLTTSFKHHDHALQLFASIVLPHHRSLKVLYLAYNDMVDVSGIAAALKSNVCLEELHLHNNCLTCESAEQLAESLQFNHTLKSLHLGYNRIHDRGCAALAQCLVRNSSLKVLGLDHNRITANGFARIETALQHNLVIEHIDLSMNDSEVAETRISLLCRANQMGRSCLGNPQFGWNFWVLVLEAVQTDPDLLFLLFEVQTGLVLVEQTTMKRSMFLLRWHRGCKTLLRRSVHTESEHRNTSGGSALDDDELKRWTHHRPCSQRILHPLKSFLVPEHSSLHRAV